MPSKFTLVPKILWIIQMIHTSYILGKLCTVPVMSAIHNVYKCLVVWNMVLFMCVYKLVPEWQRVQELNKVVWAKFRKKFLKNYKVAIIFLFLDGLFWEQLEGVNLITRNVKNIHCRKYQKVTVTDRNWMLKWNLTVNFIFFYNKLRDYIQF